VGCSTTCITMKKNTRQAQPNSSTTIAEIPDGYTIATGPNGQQYLVPQFMVPALGQAFASYQSKIELDVPNEHGGVSECIPSSINGNRHFSWIGISVGSASTLDRHANCIGHFLTSNLQSSQCQDKGFVQLSEGMLFFPPDPVSAAVFNTLTSTNP